MLLCRTWCHCNVVDFGHHSESKPESVHEVNVKSIIAPVGTRKPNLGVLPELCGFLIRNKNHRGHSAAWPQPKRRSLARCAHLTRFGPPCPALARSKLRLGAPRAPAFASLQNASHFAKPSMALVKLPGPNLLPPRLAPFILHRHFGKPRRDGQKAKTRPDSFTEKGTNF